MNYLPFEPISSCRSCYSKDFLNSISLGEMHSCGTFRAELSVSAPSGILQLVICNQCLLVQLDRNFDLDNLFRIEYGYESSLNASMANHLYRLLDEIMPYIKAEGECNYLDIGSNDATLVNYVLGQSKFNRLFAIDPTIDKFADNYSPQIEKFPDFFTFSLASKIASQGVKFSLVTSIAMFYDLPNPNDFLAGLKLILAPEGIWVLELSYLFSMLEAVAFDTICHEHLEYYSVASLVTLFERNGLRITSVTFNESNGGSMRISVVHRESLFPYFDVTPLIRSEASNSKAIAKALENMMNLVERNLKEANDYLISIKKKGMTVHGLGASTKGNTFLQYANWSTEDLPFIAEINPVKFRKYTPKSDIPIISEAESSSMNPDHYLVLPWHFKSNIIQRKQKFLNSGGKLIFVFPKFEVVDASSVFFT